MNARIATPLLDAPASSGAGTTSHLAARLHGLRSSAVRYLLAHAKAPGMISFPGGLPAP